MEGGCSIVIEMMVKGKWDKMLLLFLLQHKGLTCRFAGGVAGRGDAAFQTLLWLWWCWFNKAQKPLCPTQILQGSQVRYLPEKWDLANTSISRMLSCSFICAASKCDNKDWSSFLSSCLLMWTSSKKCEGQSWHCSLNLWSKSSSLTSMWFYTWALENWWQIHLIKALALAALRSLSA